ncbi:MAG: hypothetical protein E7172_02635 [Firmicutes bacterium]|nr:hypothetical protein [Bacillota bacterium]
MREIVQNKTKVRLFVIKYFKDEKKRLNFIGSVALTFGLRLESLSEIFGYNPDDLNQKLLLEDNYEYLHFLFNHGYRNQSLAVADFYDFFNRLMLAYSTGSKEEIKKVMLELSDYKIIDYINNHPKGKSVSEDVVVDILKFQLKYGLHPTYLADYLKIQKSWYSRRVKNLPDKYHELKAGYEYLNDFYVKVVEGYNRGQR